VKSFRGTESSTGYAEQIDPIEPLWARQIQQLEAERDLIRCQLAAEKAGRAKVRRMLGSVRFDLDHLRGTIDELLVLVRSGQ